MPWWHVPAAATLVRAIRTTCRLRISDPQGVIAGTRPGPMIMIGWHNRLLFMICTTPQAVRRKIVALASLSKDGEYAARYAKAFGINCVRGSSSRGGFRSLVEMRRRLQDGSMIFITPDGPRGPKYKVQPGPVILAEKTGAPIYPYLVNASRYWQLRGWDNTQIAKPFSRLDLVVGEAIHVPSGLSEEERRAQIARVEEALLAITKDRDDYRVAATKQ